jgi:hypothetical protein
LLGLGLVPAGGDVGVGAAAHDDQRLALGGHAPLVVVAGHVAEQGAVRSRVGVEHERQHGGQQALVGERDQIGGTVVREQLVHLGVVHGEVRGYVHLPNVGRSPAGSHPAGDRAYQR